MDIPIEPSSQPVSRSLPIEPDVQSNERRVDGRVYVMLLDDLNTHPDRTARTKNAARRFIERHLGANDLMAIVFTQANAPAQEFTSNKRLLLSAVDTFVGQEIPERTLPQPMVRPSDLQRRSATSLSSRLLEAGSSSVADAR